MKPHIKTLLNNIEAEGLRNDAHTTERAAKMLNVTRDTGEFLWMLVKTTNSKQVLEIGTSNGYSTLWIAAALPRNGKVITVEKSSEKIQLATANIAGAQLDDKIQLVHGDAKTYIPTLHEPLDFIFLDAERSEYLQFIDELIALLKPGGVIVCDNARSHEKELASFMQYLHSRKDFNCSLIDVGKGEFIAHKNKWGMTA